MQSNRGIPRVVCHIIGGAWWGIPSLHICGYQSCKIGFFQNCYWQSLNELKNFFIQVAVCYTGSIKQCVLHLDRNCGIKGSFSWSDLKVGYWVAHHICDIIQAAGDIVINRILKPDVFHSIIAIKYCWVANRYITTTCCLDDVTYQVSNPTSYTLRSNQENCLL